MPSIMMVPKDNIPIHTHSPTYLISVHPTGIGFSLDLNLPITIGTIPLQSTFNQFTPPSPLPSLPFNRGSNLHSPLKSLGLIIFI